MWIPIWIFSYTGLAKKILNNSDNIVVAITTVIVMLIGIVFMFIGMLKKDS